MVLGDVGVLEAQLLGTAPRSCNRVMAACTELPPCQGSALSSTVMPSGSMAFPKSLSGSK